MGYTTEFNGTFKVEPPLNLAEVTYLKEFAGSRRMKRHSGPYTADTSDGDYGQARTSDIIEYNRPPPCQPGLWCQWEPTEDGTGIEWNECEKFYEATAWIKYIIEHFLKEGCLAKKVDPEKFKEFVPHVVRGSVNAEGEDSGDLWQINIVDNVVSTKTGMVTYD